MMKYSAMLLYIMKNDISMIVFMKFNNYCILARVESGKLAPFLPFVCRESGGVERGFRYLH